MLTKEEVIILRTIFLEFGDKEHRQNRLQFPYENLVVEGDDKTKGNRSMANLGQFVDNLKPFGVPDLDDIVFDYYLRDNRDNCVDKLVVVDGKRYIDMAEDDLGEGLDLVIFLKNLSKNTFFIELRMGLYYKGLGEHEKAIRYLEASRSHYSKLFHNTINSASRKLYEFLVKFYDFRTKEIREPYSQKKHGLCPRLEFPVELLVSIEETPSFHLGELYLHLADTHYNDYLSLKDLPILEISKENYLTAIYHFGKSEEYCGALQYGKASQDLSISHLKEFDVLNFPEIPFKRNCYWEVNYQTSSNQLKRIEEEKFLSTIQFYEIPDHALIEKEVSKALAESNKELEAKDEELRISTEKLKNYQDVFSDPTNIPLSLKVELKLFKIFEESHKGRLYWLDKHFTSKGLSYLTDGKVAGKTKIIKILCAPDGINKDFLDKFRKLKSSFHDEKTDIFLRVITSEDVIKSFHDRWIITDKCAYNIPPVSSIPKRPLSSINREEERKTHFDNFNKLWGKGKNIFENWDEIQQKKKEYIGRRKS